MWIWSMWLLHIHACYLFYFKCLPKHGRHKPLASTAPCSNTSDSPGQGLGENISASARYTGSWQPQSGRAEINSIPGQVSISLKQMFVQWSPHCHIPYYYQEFDSILQLEDTPPPKFHGRSGSWLDPGAPMTVAHPGNWNVCLHFSGAKMRLHIFCFHLGIS